MTLTPQEARAQQASDESDAVGGTDGLTQAMEEEPGDPSLEEGLQMHVYAKTWSFKALEEEYKDDLAFQNFRTRFQTFLRGFLLNYADIQAPPSLHYSPEEEVSCGAASLMNSETNTSNALIASNL